MAALKNCSEGELRTATYSVTGSFMNVGVARPLLFGALFSASLEVLDDDRPLVPPMIRIIAFMLFALLWRNTMGRVPLETIFSESSTGYARWGAGRSKGQ
jgi:hypothetical protein